LLKSFRTEIDPIGRASFTAQISGFTGTIYIWGVCQVHNHRSERSGMGPLRAAVAADAVDLSETITLACCVTLPKLALPPSPNDTFCTVMAG